MLKIETNIMLELCLLFVNFTYDITLRMFCNILDECLKDFPGKTC